MTLKFGARETHTRSMTENFSALLRVRGSVGTALDGHTGVAVVFVSSMAFCVSATPTVTVPSPLTSTMA